MAKLIFREMDYWNEYFRKSVCMIYREKIECFLLKKFLKIKELDVYLRELTHIEYNNR